MIYDCFIPAEPKMLYSRRKAMLDGLMKGRAGDVCVHVKCVETFEVHDVGRIEELYRQFIAEGFEGAMIRVDAPYKYSYNEHHSKQLLKMKQTFDAEFTIVGFTTGDRGKAAAALMIICEVVSSDGSRIQFPVTPAMELPARVALAEKMRMVEVNGHTHFENHWMGKPLIVEFDEYSRDHVPQRARTQMILRTYE
jgi:ATP-dependent DNA ligase